MKRIIRKYSRASILMLFIYCIHAFAFNALLANNSRLFSSTTSTAQNPKKLTDYFLLLAKHEVAKKKALEDNTTISTPENILSFKVSYPAASITRDISSPRLSADNYKLYRHLKVFRI